jgi:hypothetical protein
LQNVAFMRRAAVLFCFLSSTGCYHFAFEQRPPTSTTFVTSSDGSISARPPGRLVTYERTVPTYFNGFVGTGRIDTSQFCDQPVRTELKVNTRDVLASLFTLFTYTPHTLYVTCEEERREER